MKIEITLMHPEIFMFTKPLIFLNSSKVAITRHLISEHGLNESEKSKYKIGFQEKLAYDVIKPLFLLNLNLQTTALILTLQNFVI